MLSSADVNTRKRKKRNAVIPVDQSTTVIWRIKGEVRTKLKRNLKKLKMRILFGLYSGNRGVSGAIVCSQHPISSCNVYVLSGKQVMSIQKNYNQ